MKREKLIRVGLKGRGPGCLGEGGRVRVKGEGAGEGLSLLWRDVILKFNPH